MQDAHSYLAESETLIRTHGLPKPIKSQKVSKLHHIFSFLKIIEESTSLGRRGDRSYSNGHTNDEQNQTEISSSENALVPSTNTRHSESSRLDWVQDEEPEDPDSLFISIYQMPTTLLSLVSQTTSLCKQLHLPSSSTTEFKRKCQIIEDRIFKWKAPECLAVTYPCDATSVDDSVALPNASTIAAHLVTAMHHALIVHFQRQVRNTDPRVLQHYVINVADHLLAHEQLKQSLQIPTAPFPWPGFVAGCEAYDPVAREKVALYMDCVRSYTVGNLMATEKVIREVWRRQDLGRSDKRWENVLSDWGMHIVLT
jgi:arginine metabolism regulation protein II